MERRRGLSLAAGDGDGCAVVVARRSTTVVDCALLRRRRSSGVTPAADAAETSTAADAAVVAPDDEDDDVCDQPPTTSDCSCLSRRLHCFRTAHLNARLFTSSVLSIIKYKNIADAKSPHRAAPHHNSAIFILWP